MGCSPSVAVRPKTVLESGISGQDHNSKYSSTTSPVQPANEGIDKLLNKGQIKQVIHSPLEIKKLDPVIDNNNQTPKEITKDQIQPILSTMEERNEKLIINEYIKVPMSPGKRKNIEPKGITPIAEENPTFSISIPPTTFTNIEIGSISHARFGHLSINQDQQTLKLKSKKEGIRETEREDKYSIFVNKKANGKEINSPQQPANQVRRSNISVNSVYDEMEKVGTINSPAQFSPPRNKSSPKNSQKYSIVVRSTSQNRNLSITFRNESRHTVDSESRNEKIASVTQESKMAMTFGKVLQSSHDINVPIPSFQDMTFDGNLQDNFMDRSVDHSVSNSPKRNMGEGEFGSPLRKYYRKSHMMHQVCVMREERGGIDMSTNKKLQNSKLRILQENNLIEKPDEQASVPKSELKKTKKGLLRLPSGILNYSKGRRNAAQKDTTKGHLAYRPQNLVVALHAGLKTSQTSEKNFSMLNDLSLDLDKKSAQLESSPLKKSQFLLPNISSFNTPDMARRKRSFHNKEDILRSVKSNSICYSAHDESFQNNNFQWM